MMENMFAMRNLQFVVMPIGMYCLYTPGGGGGGLTRHMTGYEPVVFKKASKGCVFQTYGVIDVFL